MKRSLFVFLTLMFLNSLSLATQTQKKLLIIGDSLTEGYGVSHDNAYPAILQQKINEAKKSWIVTNAGVSGSTSASAAGTLKWQLKSKPDLILLALGSNDGLRGLSPDEMEKNLAKAIELAQAEKIPVVMVGMQMPPNYSKDYTEKFRAVFPRLAKKYSLKLIPFLLQDVGGKPELNQPDGIHPNEKGHAIIGQNLFNELKGQL